MELQTKQNAVITTKDFFGKETVKQKFAEIMGKRATSFITSVLQIVASNDLLKDATPDSIYHSAMVAATLDLPLNNNLGFAYIVPYKTKYTDNQGQQQTKVVAQFQMGYKGFIQLFQRTGQGKSIYATEIYEGQLVDENPLDGYTFDFTKKESDKVVGYACRFKLLNGFESTFYMSKDKAEAHGKKFSQTFKKNFGLWKDDFDSMAKKTVTKLLLSKYAPLSVEMSIAVQADQAIINDAETLDVTYVDNTELTTEEVKDELRENKINQPELNLP
jgi:recombination protein RecT